MAGNSRGASDAFDVTRVLFLIYVAVIVLGIVVYVVVGVNGG